MTGHVDHGGLGGGAPRRRGRALGLLHLIQRLFLDLDLRAPHAGAGLGSQWERRVRRLEAWERPYWLGRGDCVRVWGHVGRSHASPRDALHLRDDGQVGGGEGRHGHGLGHELQGGRGGAGEVLVGQGVEGLEGGGRRQVGGHLWEGRSGLVGHLLVRGRDGSGGRGPDLRLDLPVEGRGPLGGRRRQRSG